MSGVPESRYQEMIDWDDNVYWPKLKEILDQRDSGFLSGEETRQAWQELDDSSPYSVEEYRDLLDWLWKRSPNPVSVSPEEFSEEDEPLEEVVRAFEESEKGLTKPPDDDQG